MNGYLEPPGVPPTLNDAQFALWASEPDAARLAVEAVLAELGPIFSPGDVLAFAAHATQLAAAGFDPECGVPYRQWAIFFTAARLWEQLRKAHRHDPAQCARIRAAAFRFMAHHQRFFDPWKDTRETSKETIGGFSDALLFLAARQMGVPVIASRGEDDVVEAEDARRAGEAVQKVVGELRPEQVQLLERCAAYGQPVKEVARAMGRRYRAVLEEHHQLLERCGARLRGLGIKRLPPGIPDEKSRVFHGPPANDGEPP